MNPAIAARVMLLISFAGPMTNWVLPKQLGTVDAVTSATPLALLHQGGDLPSYGQLLFGLHGGSMGETCAIALLLGGIFLIVMGVIRPIIPLTYLGGVAPI